MLVEIDFAVVIVMVAFVVVCSLLKVNYGGDCRKNLLSALCADYERICSSKDYLNILTQNKEPAQSPQIDFPVIPRYGASSQLPHK